MTFGKLQQIEAAKAALPLAIEPLQGLARYEARRLVTTAAPVLVERVIELEIQAQGMALLQADKIATLEAKVQRLKDWQERAVEYVKEGEAVYRALIKMGPPPSDDPERLTRKADVATALIAQAQGGEGR